MKKVSKLVTVFATMAMVNSIGIAQTAQTQTTYPTRSTGYMGYDNPHAVGPYVGGLFGGTFIENATMTEFGGPSSAKTKFDPGLGITFKGGYRFCDWFSLEGEVGFEGNPIDSITGASVDGSLYQIPAMANAVFWLPTRSPFTVFAGGGVGANTSILDVDHISTSTVFASGSDTDTTFAWQVFGGFHWALNDRLGLGFTYKFRRADGPNWNQDFAVAFDRIKTHTFAFAMNYRF